jgi:hypothetical protein
VAERPRLDIYHSAPSSAELEYEWMFTTAPLIRFHDVDREKLFVFLSVIYAAKYVILPFKAYQ